jgi:hypothetical protein
MTTVNIKNDIYVTFVKEAERQGKTIEDVTVLINETLRLSIYDKAYAELK